jgi:endonuclease/exonuclease/phosphatase family metal-dependent hydrolase
MLKASGIFWSGIQMPEETNWLVVGDFNLLLKPEDRNRSCGNTREMLLFNEAASSLSLVEIPLYGRKYTRTNKYQPPLLESFDWFFTSNACTLSYLHTIAKALVMETSYHWPCVIEIKITIRKGT